MRTSLASLALLLVLATTAFADGVHARIEGPAADGVTYTARVLACGKNTRLDPWAIAEGLVDGKLQSVLLDLRPTSNHCVYRFTRAWAPQGRWMIRLSLGHPPAPATIATLRADGTVEKNELFRKSDGSQECRKALKPDASPDC